MRRFRAELFEGPRSHGSKPPPPPMSSHVDGILAELNALRAQNAEAKTNVVSQSIESAIAVWSGVEDIQTRLEVTKSEISALQAKGVASNEATSRTTDELRAVVTGTEEATDTILAAAEAIDDAAQRLASNSDAAIKADGEKISEAVIQIFEACNFQDISGQRISKVVESMGFIEERIASMVDVWETIKLAREKGTPTAVAAPEPKAHDPEGLLNGPSFKDDPGVVNQDDVDAMFP
ncbi:protein phosphatase CheZ [Acuticoccus sp. MNP-M23]|uniref:protein phosphatase CheZ n=1 Tax=Acuticoccus sp. MNP-M23 TaxID=3072793 RepID=UPI0028169998|nr:protein phosphatase CheZ [Acuticoccus sp. MNP-M23]WMS41773.1 protein phosphatase CheZ [Acuticoccus sp. MNP-M23]